MDDEPEVETAESRARHALQAAAHQARLAERRAQWTTVERPADVGEDRD